MKEKEKKGLTKRKTNSSSNVLSQRKEITDALSGLRLQNIFLHEKANKLENAI
jgi:hypothetical protein